MLLKTAISRVFLLSALSLRVGAQSWIDYLKTPILTEDDRRSMMFSFVDHHLAPIDIPSTKEAWEQAREPLRKRILEVVGLQDLEKRDPVHWISRGRIERDSYSIERILFESYPGMMVPALVYVPKHITGPSPAM